MRPIQFVLIVFAVGILLFYFNRLRNRLLDRILFFVLALVAVVMVVQPEWANAVAEFLGVGRGADLLVYVGFSGLAFLWLGLYARQREMDVRLTELARRLAQLGAEKPKKAKKK
ncbi:MAG: DUF2304 domain-containing protein [Anaerolineales bacterium]